MSDGRVVGVCSYCGGDVIRLLHEGELASCPCGKSSISDALIEFARRMNPRRDRTDGSLPGRRAA